MDREMYAGLLVCLVIFAFLSIPPLLVFPIRLLFILVPRYLAKRDAKRDGLSFTLFKILSWLPTLGGDKVKIVVLDQLAHRYYLRRSYNDAIDLYRRLLACSLSAELASAYRQKLADCLDGLGMADDASQERHLASEASRQTAQTALTCITQAKLCMQNNDYPSAYALYKEALSLNTSNDPAQREYIYAKLTISSSNTGQPKDTIRWTEEGIADGVKGTNLEVMCSMAAVACINLGDLVKAEEFAMKAYRQAEASGIEDHKADRLSMLSSIQYYKGNLGEALETADRAISLAPKHCRTVYLYKHFMLKSLGRFDEALETLNQHQQCDATFNVHSQQRFDGVYFLAGASLHAESGDGEQAYHFWTQGAPAFDGDAKMTLHSKALQAWILALLGQASESRALLAEVEDTTAIAKSTGSLRDNVWYRLRAAYALEDYTLGLGLAQSYFDLSPHPVYLPATYYLLGECHRGRGEDAAAKSAYGTAVSYEFDTHFSHLAEARLREMN